MRYKDDYKAAGVPMLPAVATERQVTQQILIYTWLTVVATLALALATGWLYAAVALLAGAWFLAMAHQLYSGVGAASRSSRCGCSCSRTTIWRWCSARWRSTRRWRCPRCWGVRLEQPKGLLALAWIPAAATTLFHLASLLLLGDPAFLRPPRRFGRSPDRGRCGRSVA